MNEPTPNPNVRLGELISLALDDRLTTDEAAELERRLQQDPAAEAFMQSHLRLHADFAWRESPVRPFSREELETVAAVEEAVDEASRAAQQSPPPPAGLKPKPNEGWIIKFTSLALPWKAAAVLLIAALPVLWMAWQGGDGVGTDHPTETADGSPASGPPAMELPVVAEIVHAIGVEFAMSDRRLEESKMRAGQVIEFGSGVMQLRFGGGATVVLAAPAQFRVDSETEGTLFVGQLTATIPDSADSFVVMTPDAEVVDLGTQFSVSVSGAGKSTVHVLEGRVDVSPLKDKNEKHRVVAGQAVHLTQENRVVPLLPKKNNMAGVIRSLDTPDHRFVAVQDAFVVGGIHANERFGELTDLRVKRDIAEQQYNRKVWIAFDLSNISREQIRAARLTLAIFPNTIAQERTPNYKPIDNSWQFTVSGLWDEFFEPWNEGSITWNNGPGNAPTVTSGSLTGSRAPTPVGSFRIERSGDYGQQVVVESPQLTEFLKADQDGYVTLIINRESGYTWSGSEDEVVHGFASREYKKLPPPTLEIWGE